MKATLIAITLLFSTLLGFAEASYTCTIKGVTVNRSSKVLYLKKIADDEKGSSKRIINIKNNVFEYTFKVTETQAYELVFEDEIEKGSWHPVVFFPVQGVVSVTLYPFDDADKDQITGGPLNAAYTAYNKDMDRLFKQRGDEQSAKWDVLFQKKEYYSPQRDSLIRITQAAGHDKVDPAIWKRLREMEKTGEAYTEKGKAHNKESDALAAARLSKRYEYIARHTDQLSYYFLYIDAITAKDNMPLLADVKKNFPVFAKAFPNHSYTKIISSVLTGYNKVKVGEQLENITLPDLTGNVYSLKELSKDKYTLIDFWGSWCGPCIAATRTMLPVYSEFKNKGFTIVGIAKEYKTTRDLKIALKREKYPWLNLVELDDKNGIWNKFGITNSTGMMLLVDKQGKILAVDPTAADVRNFLLANN